MPTNTQRLFTGGIPIGSITEVVGRADVGKTQVGRWIFYPVQAAMDGGGSIFIDAEKKSVCKV